MMRMRVDTATAPTILRGDDPSELKNPAGAIVGVAEGTAAVSVGWRRASSFVGVGATDSRRTEDGGGISEEREEEVEVAGGVYEVVGAT